MDFFVLIVFKNHAVNVLPLLRWEIDIRITDSFLQGFVCTSGHKLSSCLKEYSQEEYWKARHVKVNKKGKKEILEEWLGNPDYRRKLPHQLCELLRAELDLMDGKQLNKVSDYEYQYCPICSEGLSSRESRDVWVECAECKNGHIWWMRHEIWSNDQKIRQRLDVTYYNYMMLKSFYKENEEHRKCMPEQIWEVI